jgi:hypothetical protein
MMKFTPNFAMRAVLIGALITLSPLPVLDSTPDDIPAAVRARKPGRHELVTKLENAKYAKDGVEAELIIPSGISGPAPMVVFIHGNARNLKYYKIAANFFVPEAAQRKVLILSVQNWWPLSGDHLEATEETRYGTNILVNQLVQAGVVKPDKVFLSGFSAGGLAIVATFLESIDCYKNETYREKFIKATAQQAQQANKSPEELYYNVLNPGRAAGFFSYAGFLSIKGNFYTKYFKLDSIITAEERRKMLEGFFASRRIVLTVGGDHEAKDVKWEVPILRDFLKTQWGAKLDYHEYGDQGHDIYKSDQQFLWEMLEEDSTPATTAYEKPPVVATPGAAVASPTAPAAVKK